MNEANMETPEQWAVIDGNLRKGLRVVGPFDTQDEAAEYNERGAFFGWVFKLEPPKSWDED